jgi:hypothetical protein
VGRRGWLVLGLGGLLVLPAVLFVVANVLKHGLGFPALADALGPLAEPRGVAEAVVSAAVLLGPVLAMAVVLAPIVRLRTARSMGALEATVSLRVRRANLMVAGLAFAVLAVLGAYLLAENARCWFGSSVAC